MAAACKAFQCRANDPNSLGCREVKPREILRDRASVQPEEAEEAMETLI
jgi:hypothetical protein